MASAPALALRAQPLGLRAAAPVWLRIGEGRHSAVTCTGYILLEELLHNQMHLRAVDYLQRKGEI